MSTKKFSESIEKSFKNVELLFQGMINDRSVPRNIKRIAQRGIGMIQGKEKTPGEISSSILYMVEDLSQDPNIPFHSRSVIYRIISILETIKD
ncbi:MAG TPA: UPF0147 family protein [Candidatus Lokiarchaeia archaeon]